MPDTKDFSTPETQRGQNWCTSVCPFLPSLSNKRLKPPTKWKNSGKVTMKIAAYVCVKCQFTIHLDRRKKCLAPLKRPNDETTPGSGHVGRSNQPLLTWHSSRNMFVLLLSTWWGHLIHILHWYAAKWWIKTMCSLLLAHGFIPPDTWLLWMQTLWCNYSTSMECLFNASDQQ